MSDELINILPLPRLTTDDPCLIHPDIPSGSCLIVAPTNSGKTTLIVNLLLRKVFGVLVHYKYIYVYSPTCRTDSSWDLLQPDVYRPFKLRCRDGKRRQTAHIELNETLDMNKIHELMQAQDALPRDERPNTLLVIDDFASDIRDDVTLSRLAMRGRHSRLWLWVSTQLYRRIPRSIRVNMPYYILFSVNQNELKTLSEELSTGSQAEFEAMFKACTNKAFGFLTVNMKKPVAERYTCNFKKI